MTTEAVAVKSDKKKYSCSNPNCKQIFSEPKVIKYYMCPTCQTLIDVNDIDEEQEIDVELTTRTPAELQIEPICSEEAHIQSRITTEAIDNSPVKAEKSTIEEDTSPIDKTEDTSPIDKTEDTSPIDKTEDSENPIMPEPIQISPQSTLESSTSHQLLEIETKSASHSKSDCPHGFGYLSQREKGESIPDLCIECPDSLRCMLSEFYKKEESVEEIKKWYFP